MQKLLLYILLFSPFIVFSQQIERVMIAGSITAPPGEDLGAISIYNVSSQKRDESHLCNISEPQILMD